jgi:alcohol dehydrogenase
VPLADGTLIKALPDGGKPDESLIPSLLTLTDVFTTGYHAAVCAHVKAGDTVTVVGDGAVGLCAIMAAKLLGASRVINAGSSHEDRHRLARLFGADEVIEARGQKAVETVESLTSGSMSDVVLECVGSAQSFTTAIAMCAAGGSVSYVGLPHGVEIDVKSLFYKNVTIAGGMSPAHHYIEALLPTVLKREINPGMVYTQEYALEDIAQAYEDMDQRRTIKPMIKVR